MKTKIVQIITLVLVVIMLMHCKKASLENIETPKKGNIGVLKPESKKHDIKLVATPQIHDVEYDAEVMPKVKIELIVDGKRYEIAKLVGNSNGWTETQTAKMVPKNTISSCFVWWAGAGDYFYVIQQDGKVVVYKGWEDEGEEYSEEKINGGVNYHWEIAKEVNL
jgi:hypothetical protein